MSIRFRSHPRPLLPDLRLLQPRDRAILRLVNRSKAATTQQLTDLTRAHLRKIQDRTRLMWRAGYLERSTLPPPVRGGSPLAHRLTTASRRRLGYHDRRLAGINELQHRLDTVQAVCALARPVDAHTPYPMQAWLTESLSRGLLGPNPQPDAVITLQLPSGSCVLCLEVDEATQHVPIIRHKLLAYRRALAERAGWHLLFVVPTDARRRWLQRQARATPRLHGWQQGWVAVLGTLEAAGLASRVRPLTTAIAPATLDSLATDPTPRQCPTPVGSPEWLDLLGSGGGEEWGNALR